MEVLSTRLEGPMLLRPTVHRDERGFFVETLRADELHEIGMHDEFVQENHSRSVRGTLRGLHYQSGDGQAKLVRVARGEIWDVIVDLRPESPTYAEWESFTLDDASHHQLYIPRGFAHGFCVLSDVADVLYKVSTYFDPALERGIAWDDAQIGVQWPISDPLLSRRDRSNPRFAEIN